ncbi:DNA replication/repair protein RecF [Hyphomicrobium facile]|uniref:DNA replication and repair protein RecF n=1 Tax=Hyphomicrobium facile TaxID=51670 RepID=A0A1I7MTF4_9HYPH|nr:DNA replication/repair protein RecF [Hyphomicrobium facile]SFV25685.1 DNA replication and repair protein RecF [Hyphomicrobium facile]
MTLWVERLTLTNFRSYVSASVATDAGPQVIVGANGSGKTNLLEALSLLSPGTGLRRVPFVELARAGGDGSFAIAAHAHTLSGPADIGTGLQARAGFTPTPNPSPQGGGESHSQGGGGFSRSSDRGERSGRIVRIDGSAQSGSGILADYLEIVWVTPAMDGLFTGPASERRRFLDRLILCFDHSYRTIAGQFERAMTSRNRLLADGVRDNAQLSGFEQVMAETGVAVAAARLEAVAAMAAIVEKRRERDPNSAFPWSSFRLVGTIEDDLRRLSAIEAEDAYARTLRETRERDRAASRTLDGPHRSDLIVEHGPKALEARQCSTGEQKALLLGLVLAHAELLTERQEGAAPILLLDEITAHLDVHRRAALFAEILRLGAQAWMTGTDAEAFSALRETARFWGVEEGKIRALS